MTGKSATLDTKSHVYSVEGKEGYVSTTTFLHTLYTPFDAKAMAANKAKSKSQQTPPPRIGDTTYVRMRNNKPMLDHLITQYGERPWTEQEISDAIECIWERNGEMARTMGTQLHEYCEHLFLGHNPQNIPALEGEVKQANLFRQYCTENGYETFKAEWIVVDPIYNIAGTIDLVLYNKRTKTFHIIDWKRTKRISTYGFKGARCLPPVEHLPDSNYYHYCLQLNMYKYMCERYYQIKIHDMHLVVLYPTQRIPEMFKVMDLQQEIYTITRDRETSSVVR
jgi:ATP-dependent exoDNAse (exonuclease V) beta subunit